MKDYGLREWFVFAIGAIAVAYQLYLYMIQDLKGNLLDGIVFGASIILMFAPKTLVDIAAKKLGKRE